MNNSPKNPWPLFIVLVVCFGIAAFAAWYIEVNFLTPIDKVQP